MARIWLHNVLYTPFGAPLFAWQETSAHALYEAWSPAQQLVGFKRGYSSTTPNASIILLQCSKMYN